MPMPTFYITSITATAIIGILRAYTSGKRSNKRRDASSASE